MVSIIVGGHYGDEGKGKVISYLALNDRPGLIARAGVGPNAGHTVYKNGKKFGLRMIPCGFVNESSRLAIGAGVLIDIERFLKEVEETQTKGRIFLDGRCTVIEQSHKNLDKGSGSQKIGTTGSGCGPANAARVNRTAKRALDFPELKDYLADVPQMVNDAVDSGGNVLVEASQGFGLSLYYGNYPYVTSKDTSASTAAADVGLGPTKIDDVIVVFKAYMSRVGADPFVHYLTDDEVGKSKVWSRLLKKAEEAGVTGNNANEKIAFYLGEKGTVTGRPRKIADFDFKLARYSTMVNGATMICVTCLDKLYPESAGVRDYKKLSPEAAAHIQKIETEVGVKVKLISTGPEPEDLIDLR
jgi:adenylosuccinate synthase